MSNGVITTGNFSKALWPGINAWYGEEYDEWTTEYTEIFDTYPAQYRTEQDVLFSGFGLLSEKDEGAPISFDSAQQGFTTSYDQITYSRGFIVTREMLEDDQYNLMEKRARALAFSIRQTKEVTGAFVLNQAFNTAVTYGDGEELISTSHPNQAGGTWANRAAVDADLSETAIENGLILIDDFRDDRGLRIAVHGKKLIVPIELRYEAERILNSVLQNDSELNAVNAVRNMGALPDGYCVNHYLTDPNAWFIKSNVSDGFKQFVKREDSFEEDNDFSTENLLYKVSGRWAFGVTDPRCVFGSAGA